MKIVIDEEEAKSIMENYVRRTFELTPEYAVGVQKKSYEDHYTVVVEKPKMIVRNEE